MVWKQSRFWTALQFQSFFENVALSKKMGMAPNLVIDDSAETVEIEGNWIDDDEDAADDSNATKRNEQVIIHGEMHP